MPMRATLFAIRTNGLRRCGRPLALLLACLTAWPLAYGKPYPLPPALKDEPVALTPEERESILRSPEAEVRLQPLRYLAEEERWRDIAGRPYSNLFRCAYHYDQAEVKVVYGRLGPVFRGRLRARGLKPNFAYQIKLQGDFAADPATHRRLGYLGRWRLPGKGTNYSDADYESASDRSQVESYILFEYFVTDHRGEAAMEFCLDSSLHVLWNDALNESLRWGDTPPRIFCARAQGPAYAERDWGTARVALSAENEGPARRRFALAEVRLPRGRYRCRLVLTEESFHDRSEGGGHWATVLGAPVSFIIDDARPWADIKQNHSGTAR
ncbi:MAG: hypothetical protein N3A66_11830 [Planctomycetota bacterium]|nr:hypothetical protein [Planctomycetota bacterium]